MSLQKLLFKMSVGKSLKIPCNNVQTILYKSYNLHKKQGDENHHTNLDYDEFWEGVEL